MSLAMALEALKEDDGLNFVQQGEGGFFVSSFLLSLGAKGVEVEGKP